MIILSISTNQKNEVYDFIFIIINWFIKILYYKPVKIIIYIPNYT